MERGKDADLDLNLAQRENIDSDEGTPSFGGETVDVMYNPDEPVRARESTACEDGGGAYAKVSVCS